MTSNGRVIDGRVVEGEGDSEAQNALLSLRSKAENLLKDKQRSHSALAPLYKSMKLQQASGKWGKPGQTAITVRREGVLRRKNPADRKRNEAAKANEDLGILLGKHFTGLTKYAASGKKYLMEVIQYIIEMDADLPEELQPIGQALTEDIYQVLTATYQEDLIILSELGLEEIVRAFQDTEV